MIASLASRNDAAASVAVLVVACERRHGTRKAWERVMHALVGHRMQTSGQMALVRCGPTMCLMGWRDAVDLKTTTVSLPRKNEQL